MLNKRSDFLDIVKGFTIILVIIGHSIQFGSGFAYSNNQLYFDNIVFKFIYSFHMPLFMIISGYLFYFSIVKKSTKNIFFNRFTTLLVPIISFSFITVLIKMGKSVFVIDDIISFFKIFIYTCRGELWFLWSILFCSLLVILVDKLFKDNVYVYLAIFIISFFIPDVFNLEMYKYMYPFFVSGYLFNKYSLTERTKSFNILKITVPLGVFFILLLLFFNIDSYIYTTGHYILKGDPLKYLFNNLYRTLIGFVGSLFIICCIYAFRLKLRINVIDKILVFIGKKSLGIYVLSGYIYIYILPVITEYFINLNYFYMIVETLIILVICLIVTSLLQKIKITNTLFFGCRS